MKHTLNAAAKLSGRAKSTISKAIKDGRLSAAKNDKGGFEIDGAELSRVFPFPAADQTLVPQSNTENEHKNKVLEVELKAERQMRERLLSEIEDLKIQRDKWQDQAQTLLLSNQSQPEGQGAKRGFLGLFRR
jgi:FtsZ-binding cell division protein ZapB